MEQTIEKLLHQEFSQKMRGYDRDEVDNFLDEVIEDIEKLQKKYELLLDEKKILEKNNFELKMKMLGMQEKMNSNQAASQTVMLGETRLVSPEQQAAATNRPAPAPTRQVQYAPQPTQRIQPEEIQTSADEEVTMQFDQEFGQAVTHEDSKANDHTLQDRIEQLERELNNIKNFSE